jgi:hypothetical protein
VSNVTADFDINARMNRRVALVRAANYLWDKHNGEYNEWTTETGIYHVWRGYNFPTYSIRPGYAVRVRLEQRNT